MEKLEAKLKQDAPVEEKLESMFTYIKRLTAEKKKSDSLQTQIVGRTLALEKKCGAAFELAAENRLDIEQVAKTSHDSARQYSKYVLHFSGTGMPPRCKEGEQDMRRYLTDIVKQLFKAPIDPDDIATAHYLGKGNEILAKFEQIGPHTARDTILDHSRDFRPTNVYARVFIPPCDRELYFLLRMCKKAGQCEKVITTRAGKPAIIVRKGSQTSVEPFDTVADVRSFMSDRAMEFENEFEKAKGERNSSYVVERALDKKAIKRTFHEVAAENIDAMTNEKGGVIEMPAEKRLKLELDHHTKIKQIKYSRRRKPGRILSSGAPITAGKRKNESVNMLPLGKQPKMTSEDGTVLLAEDNVSID